MTNAQLISEADAAERLAAIVNYRPDKARLLEQAARLREMAARTEDRSWDRDSAFSNAWKVQRPN